MKNLLTSPLGCVAPYIPALRKAMIRFAHPTPFLKWGSYGADDNIARVTFLTGMYLVGLEPTTARL